MGLIGRLIAAIEFKAGGDVFHQLFKNRPQEVATVSPAVQGCDLHKGDFAKPGSIVTWRYTVEGKAKAAKVLIESIDEGKKLIKWNTLGGYLLELYKTMVVTCHVDTKDGIDLVTWTLEYERLNEDVEHPMSFLAFFIGLTKDIETHHLAKP